MPPAECRPPMPLADAARRLPPAECRPPNAARRMPPAVATTATVAATAAARRRRCRCLPPSRVRLQPTSPNPIPPAPPAAAHTFFRRLPARRPNTNHRSMTSHRRHPALRLAIGSLSLLAALAFALSACASQDTFKVCTALGETYLCPEHLECNGAQPVCVAATCGNLVIDTGEECDDGNIAGGDGCSPRCLIEQCGNRVLDPGEVCDDGNTRDGDGCSADCHSTERCGNHILDRAAGEVCDDGNTSDGDGCSANCRSDETCGNDILDIAAGEVCDTGPGGSAQCSADCHSTLACNNLVLDPGEECDRGLFAPNNPTGNANQNDCRADCVFNRCGDGYVDLEPGPHAEDCDGAPPVPPGSLEAHPVETAACNLDCTLPRCGDGKVNLAAGETCDDSNNLDGDGCSQLCKVEFCGDGIVNNHEACDPLLTPATCNYDCTPSACGDGKANPSAIPPELCDDHNTAPGDGCSATCQFEVCGNGVVDPPEECDGAAGLQPCSAQCHQERCGNGILDRDVVSGVFEECDDGNLVNGDGCSHDCEFE
jgi:cysteine-rich repeat protein